MKPFGVARLRPTLGKFIDCHFPFLSESLRPQAAALLGQVACHVAGGGLAGGVRVGSGRLVHGQRAPEPMHVGTVHQAADFAYQGYVGAQDRSSFKSMAFSIAAISSAASSSASWVLSANNI